ncbi:hypothetical protein [Deinococcus sp.]|uniref:hypothetical protein n=1 Tax=Deinococcus sp. TaxID=47478 RepID=UPI003CC5BFB3
MIGGREEDRNARHQATHQTSERAASPPGEGPGPEGLPAHELRPPPPGVQPLCLIQGGFTHDALPDLFRYLCSRGESLWWELSTLAGRFTLTFERGLPTDVMFSPARPVGARVGMKALRILFQQEGGRFAVHRGLPSQQRRTLHLSGEQLLIELATRDDETLAPAVLSGVQVDLSAELELVEDLPPPDHRTAFRTSSADVPLTDVLQLFSVSRQAYWINLLGPQEERLGRLLLSASEVVSAEYAALKGERAFTALLGHPAPCTIDVSPPSFQTPGPQAGKGSVGKLDALLMRELLSGRLSLPPNGSLDHLERERGGHQPSGGAALLARVRGLFGAGKR